MARQGGSLLIVGATSTPPVTDTFLTTNKATIFGGRLFGGTNSSS
jgi:hypothetical protein